jgi:hypothetical protein
MRDILQMAAADIVPSRQRVLDLVGFPATATPRAAVEELLDKALGLLQQSAEPRGLVASIGCSEFAQVYRGDGLNDPETPLESIFPQAAALALFAVTLGEPLSTRIHGLFDSQDFALGYMLDAAASEGVEQAGELLEQHYLDALRREGHVGSEAVPLRYSPGYCGWHMSGQKAIFAALRPGDVGISLGESFLMQPLKSMSGVMVVGQREIHRFENNFPFCADCRDWSCRVRIQELQGSGRS